MTSALALARHRLVIERRDGPRWAEALREGAAMKRRRSRAVQRAAFQLGTNEDVSELGFYVMHPGIKRLAAWPAEREIGMPLPWRNSGQEGETR